MAFENLKGFLHVQVLCLLQYSCLIQMLVKVKIEKKVLKRDQNKTKQADAHQDICPAFAQLHHHNVWLDCLKEYSC